MSRKKRKGARKPRPRKPRPRKQRARPVRRRQAAASRAEPQDSGLKRWSRLLTKFEKDPESALKDPRCLKPHFLNELFDLCEGKALEAPWVAPDLVDVALQLAERNGDPHLMNRAAGVGVHVLINGTAYDEADQMLQEYREQAFDCCRDCAAEWYRHQGDLLVETRDPRQARLCLDLSASILGEDLDDDTRARTLFVRGIAHLFLRRRDQALADIDECLRLLSLTSSRGYFNDAVALVACFLQGGDEERHDELALDILARFRARLKDQKGFAEVRDRVRWVAGLAHGRLGHTRRARKLFTRSREGHLGHFPHRYALAIAADEMLILCRKHPEMFIRSIRLIMTWCKQNLKLEPEHRKRLRKAAKDLGTDPWYSRQIISSLRRSYTVPVPGLLCDDVLEDDDEDAA
ncbi:MAG: hypothetical protein GY719_07795 [bacterium]|nr:hypothetical protein [bacterium]